MSADSEAQKKTKFIESNAGDGTNVHEQHLTGFELYSGCLACFMSLFLMGLDQTIVLTILVDVGNKFNAYDKIGWLASSFMLSLAVFAATFGKLSIIFGRKYCILVSIILFEIGSLVCALAQNINTLIVGRVIAGIGGAGIQNLVFIIVGEMVPISKRPLAYASMGIVSAVSTVSGPLIGGAFTQHVTWRWCFYINLPLGGLAALALTLFFNPPRPDGSFMKKLKMVDYLGSFLLIDGLVLVLLGLSFGGEEFPWRSAAVICLFVFGGLLLIAFCIWNFRYSQYPVIPFELIKIPGVILPSLVLCFAMFYFMGLTIYFTAYFQIVHGSDAFKTGLHLLPIVISIILASVICGVLIKKTTYIKPLSVIGVIFGCVGSGLLALWNVDSSNGLIIGLMILPGASIGTLIQSCMMGSQVSAPKTPGSLILATTIQNFFRALGGSIGSTLSQTVFNSSVRRKLNDALRQNSGGLASYSESSLQNIISSPDLIKKLSPEAKKVVLECIMSSIKNVFYTATGVACLMLFLICFAPNKRLPKEDEVQSKEEYEREHANEEIKNGESMKERDQTDNKIEQEDPSS